jgi:hypothetical protein
MESPPFLSENSPESESDGSGHVDRVESLWRFFVSVRGSPLLPSCREIEALLGLLLREIPDEVIRAGISQAVTEYRDKSLRRNPSLVDCTREIVRLHRERLHRHLVAATRETPESVESPQVRLDRSIAIAEKGIEENLGRIPLSTEERKVVSRKLIAHFRRILSEIESPSLESLDLIFNRLDGKLAKLLMKAIPPDELTAMSQEAEHGLRLLKPDIGRAEVDRLIPILVQERARSRYRLRPLNWSMT